MLLTGGGLSLPAGDYETTLQPATLSCGFRSVVNGNKEWICLTYAMVEQIKWKSEGPSIMNNIFKTYVQYVF